MVMISCTQASRTGNETSNEARNSAAVLGFDVGSADRKRTLDVLLDDVEGANAAADEALMVKLMYSAASAMMYGGYIRHTSVR